MYVDFPPLHRVLAILCVRVCMWVYSGDLTAHVLVCVTGDILTKCNCAMGQPMSREVLDLFAEIGVGMEVMDTKNASHTFNVLNQESRIVAAALLPMGYRLPD